MKSSTRGGEVTRGLRLLKLPQETLPGSRLSPCLFRLLAHDSANTRGLGHIRRTSKTKDAHQFAAK